MAIDRATRRRLAKIYATERCLICGEPLKRGPRKDMIRLLAPKRGEDEEKRVMGYAHRACDAAVRSRIARAAWAARPWWRKAIDWIAARVRRLKFERRRRR